MNRVKDISHTFLNACKYSLTVYTLTLATLYTSVALCEDVDSSNASWDPYRKEYGITGYERKQDLVKYIETRAETLIDAPAEIILEVLKDVPSYPKWMYKCKEAIELKANADESRMIYIAQGSPLGSPERDVILETKNEVDWDLGRYVITINATTNHSFQHPDAEKRDNRVRMIDFRGKWEFLLVDRTHTRVTYTIYTDPGGFAPGFIVNDMMRDVSFLSLKGLSSMVKDSRYIEAASSSQAKQLIESNWKDNDG